MKFCILMGSPRLKGNTAELLKPFIAELEFNNACTSPMKAFLDRHYGLNKYYGSAKGSLWEGKKVAIIATHGYDIEYGTGPFETGVKRLCSIRS